MASNSSPALTGEEISALAYALPPLTPTGLSSAVEVLSICLGILAAIIVSLRVYVRAGFSGAAGRLWGIEEYLVLTGFLPFIPCVIFAVLAARYGVGLLDEQLPSPFYGIRASEYLIYWEILYFISSTLVKCAIGFACVRLDPRKRIRYPLVINMVVMVLVAILALVFVFANCRPFAATWNPYLGTCQKTISLQTVSYIVSAIQMATDWTCAVVPFFIVARLQMPRRKKVSIVCILGLGILASIATCIRMPYLKYYDTVTYPTDTTFHLGVIIITSNIECSLGIIACSLPPLRKLFKFYYGSSTDPETNKSDKTATRGTKLGSLTPHGKYLVSVQGRSTNGEWDRLDDDASSREGIMRKTEVFLSSSAK